MATDVPKPLSKVELKELENAVNRALRSKDTLHELAEWRQVGDLFATYAERVVAELKGYRDLLIRNDELRGRNEALRSVLSRLATVMQSGSKEEREATLLEVADTIKLAVP
ncbi:MAG TPA: hypothetical protein VE964_04515 [Myxococcales bacterium]|nr:hypothetical protein [Myxococcales bacterium]